MPLNDMTPRQQAILETFDYHRPSPEAAARIERIRFAFKLCALHVFENTPDGADQTAALRQLHEAMMTANKSIACAPGSERLAPMATDGDGAPCRVPPVGWTCTRPAGHNGPCAASPMDGRDPNPGC